MWGTAVPKDTEKDEGDRPRNPWHNNEAGAQNGEEITAVPTPETDENGSDKGGTWGERDAGNPSQRMAMEDFEVLRETLTSMSRTKSHPERPDGLIASMTRKSGRRSIADEEKLADKLEDFESTSSNPDDDDFELGQFMREGHFEKRVDGQSAKKVGVVWKNLTVKGITATASSVKTLPYAVLGTFGPDLYRIISGFVPALRLKRHNQTRILLNDFSGVVRDGEMMLVLGRPGSGCTTFLKAIANDREGYAAVTGEVSYGGISARKVKKNFRGEVNYNPEDDVHFPTLTVWQTLYLALLTKTKKSEREKIPIVLNALLKMFGITHTKNTLVGDAFVRGVSGGERKRVSIAETLASKSTVVCWDNSTRGLDASTALDYAKSLRIMTDISNRTTFVTLYQAGEEIYALMDKVMVLDQGRVIFQGPVNEARQYFIDLGYHSPGRQTTPDFLTAITDPTERQFREGYENTAPRTPEELEMAFRRSPHYQRVLAEVDAYEKELEESDHIDAKEFETAVRESKSKTVQKKSSFTVSFIRQVWACTIREFWLTWGDKTAIVTKFFIIIGIGLVVGSLFHGQNLGTSGAFSRGGSVFFSMIFLGWLQMSELVKAVSGRTVVKRHNEYAFYHPSAVVISRVLQDIVYLFIQVVPFSIIMYFLTGLDVDASKFWIYLLFIYTTTLCITALYRMFAAFSPTIDDAIRFSGLALNIFIVLAGYVIPKTQLVNKYIWFGWLYYLNPLSYAFEAAQANEFANRDMECEPMQLIPQGPGVDPRFQGCAITGALPNSRDVPGSSYIYASFGYTRHHLWRNFGALLGFAVLYVLVTVIGTELFSFAASGGGALVFKRGSRSKKNIMGGQVDEENVVAGEGATSNNTRFDKKDENMEKISSSESIFTWKDVEYTVPTADGDRKLLNKVSGYAKPGVMIALMGASGAGKTTLLNTLSQRQTVGVVSGEMLVDGKPLGKDFQRSTGYCEQMDLHDGSATIREALEFSAILRQDHHIPKKEKLEYVDKIIDLLELEDIQDALVSALGVEQRKRLTIGVELAAKPSLLLFLDEPTSGLDSNSAYSIVRFLKKLSAAGQAILCTIHQPSSVLIQQFDMILALDHGGNMLYFGPVGEDGKDVISYFGHRGVHCPPNKNVAEFVLETAAKPIKREDGTKIDWKDEWLKSEESKGVYAEIDRISSERSKLERESTHEEREYAAPLWLQITMLTKRVFIQHWRDSSYMYGKFFTAVMIGILNGFTFYKLANSIQDMQNRMFSTFLVIIIPPTIINGILSKFYMNMALWQAREMPSRIYGWVAFVTAQVVTEIPFAIISSVLYFLLWYFPSGLPRDSATAGYSFLMTMLFFLFTMSWGQWICAFAPTFTVISNILPFFFVMFSLFNGVVTPYSSLNVFWKYWMYYLNPSTYWVGGMLANVLHGQPVECTVAETARFDTPPGQTCSEYASSFLASAPGYLLNPNATKDCQYCPFTTGDDYLSTLHIKHDEKWRDFGVFLAFCVSNWALVYFLIWSCRMKGWSFGFGYVVRGIEGVGKLFSRKK